MRRAVFVGLVGLVAGCGSSTTLRLEADAGPDARTGAAIEAGDPEVGASGDVGPRVDAGTGDGHPDDAVANDEATANDVLAPEASTACDPLSANNCQDLDVNTESTVCAPPRTVLHGLKLVWSVESTCAGLSYPPCATSACPNPALTSIGAQCAMTIDGLCYLVELVSP